MNGIRTDSGGLAVGAGDEDVDVAADLAGSGDGVEGGSLEALAVVFGNDENGHGWSLSSVLKSVDADGHGSRG